jgi:hypothetical protein
MASSSNPRSRRWLGLSAALVLAVQGCAVNPYSQNPRPNEAELSAAATNGKSPMRGSLQYEVLRADALNARYQQMLSDELDRQQKISGTMIALGTAALGAALFKAHSDVLLALATGGVLTYQLGTWNSNDSRLNIYLEGMKAVACLKAAVEPLRISEEQLKRIALLAGATRNEIDTTATVAGEVTRWLAVTGGEAGSASALRQTAASELTEAGAQLTQASELLASEAGLANRVEGAGHLMERKLDEIDRLVSAALRGTLADLSALPRFIGEAANYASIVVPGLKGDVAMSKAVGAANAKVTPGVTAQYGAAVVQMTPTDALADALGRLRQQRVRLAARAQQLNGALASATALAQVRSAADSCGLESSKLATAIAIERPELTFKPGEKVRKEVVISGGTRPYSARFQEVPTKGFRPADVPPGAAVVYVESEGDAPAGSVYHVRVSDSTLAGVQLAVRVEDPAADGERSGAGPAGQTTGPHTTATLKCSGYEARSREELCLVQKVTGTAVDGQFGTNSCAAFHRSAATAHFKGLLNDQAMNAVKAAVLLQPGAGAAEMRAKLTAGEQATCRLPAAPAAAAGNPTAPSVAAPLAGAPAPPPATIAAAASLPASAQAQAPVVAATAAASAVPTGSRCDPVPDPKQCKVPTAQARCQFECGLTEGEIRRLRGKLGLPEAPVTFDRDLRESLSGFQQRRQLEPKGEYNPDTARVLRLGS